MAEPEIQVSNARRPRRAGQATVEFVIACLIILPLTFGLLFTSQMLWIWHSVNDFTRQGAGYASTHCWQNSTGNVLEFMRTNTPLMIDRTQFQSGPVQINVSYFGKDADTGQLVPFQCDSECSTGCIPDTVTVSISGYEYRTFFNSLGIAPVQLPDFRTSLPMESAGCDPETQQCLP